MKPSNLMLSSPPSPRSGKRKGVAERSIVKILDLGLARFYTSHHTALTSTGQMMGTVDYMAPEQVTDSHNVDIRADVYSLGCTIYRLLTGAAPFEEGKYDNMIYKAMAHVETPPPPIRQRRADIPEALAAVIERTLAKEPADRFATPEELADAMAPFAEQHDLAALLSADPQPADAAIDKEVATVPPTSASVGTQRAAPQDSEPTVPPATGGVRRWLPPKIAAIAAGFGECSFGVFRHSSRYSFVKLGWIDSMDRV